MANWDVRKVAGHFNVALTTVYDWCRTGRLRSGQDCNGQTIFDSDYIQSIEVETFKRRRGRKHVRDGERTLRRGFSANEGLINRFESEARRIGIKGSELFRVMNEVYFQNVDTDEDDDQQEQQAV